MSARGVPPKRSESRLAEHDDASLELIPIPRDLQEAWERAARADHSEPMIRALYRVALGESFRQAAEAEGYGDHAGVWRVAKRHGLVDSKKERLLNGQRRVATLATDELERRLVENPDEVSSRDLTVAAGVAIDKISAAENWSNADEDRSTNVGLAALAQKIVEQGGTLELRVSPAAERAADAPEMEEIDVTPERGEAPVVASDLKPLGGAGRVA